MQQRKVEWKKNTENSPKTNSSGSLRKLPEIRKQEGELQEAFRSASKEKLKEILGDGVWWAPLYELSIVQVLALLFHVLGQTEWLKVIAQSPDPQEEALKWIEIDEDLEWNGGTGGIYSKGDVIAVLTALLRNILSIMVYKRSLCSLIEEAREGNDDMPV